MQAIPRCRSLLKFGNSGIFHPTQLNLFHSTPVCDEKWKKKWNSDFKADRQHTKSYNKYVKRQRRADAKRALKNIAFDCGIFDNIFQPKDHPKGKKKKKSSWDGWHLGSEDDSAETERSKAPRGKRATKRNPNRKRRRRYFSEDDEPHETVFHARFGNRWYSWSFNPFHGSFQSFTSGFEHEEDRHRKDDRRRWWEAADDIGSDEEVGKVGLRSERTMLGLPPYGPLKIEDVKNAFRLSALKWHPDKHQGPSQVEAEEKFKHCVNAYNSLCDALPPA